MSLNKETRPNLIMITEKKTALSKFKTYIKLVQRFLYFLKVCLEHTEDDFFA